MTRRGPLAILCLVTLLGILHIWFEQFLWGIKRGVYVTEREVEAELMKLENEGLLPRTEDPTVHGRIVFASFRASSRALPDEVELLIVLGCSFGALVVVGWPTRRAPTATVSA